jgi:hypothetical protein
VHEAKAAADGWQEVMDKEMRNIRFYDVYELAACAKHDPAWVLHQRVKNGVGLSAPGVPLHASSDSGYPRP